jgi:hypothetical protein
MIPSSSSTGWRDGDDDENGNGQNPLQRPDAGPETGEYHHPDYIPGEEKVDNAQL